MALSLIAGREIINTTHAGKLPAVQARKTAPLKMMYEAGPVNKIYTVQPVVSSILVNSHMRQAIPVDVIFLFILKVLCISKYWYKKN
ncbi:MAG: hypothetical protein H7258_08880 [Ferruginibacter sp.]|nr:hypothetical protein [Ferruginibacter sp.]